MNTREGGLGYVLNEFSICMLNLAARKGLSGTEGGFQETTKLHPWCEYVRRFEAEEKVQACDRVATEKDSTAFR